MLVRGQPPVGEAGQEPPVGEEPPHQRGPGRGGPGPVDGAAQLGAGAHRVMEVVLDGQAVGPALHEALLGSLHHLDAEVLARRAHRPPLGQADVEEVVDLLSRQPDVPEPGAGHELVVERVRPPPGRGRDHLDQPRVTLQGGYLVVLDGLDPDAAEPGDRRLHDRRLTEGGQDLGDVAEEATVGPHHQHAVALEGLTVVVEQERGPVEADRRLARARTTLDDEQLVERGPDDHVLLGLDRRHDVAHLAGAGAVELGEEGIGHTGGVVGAVRVVEVLVEQADELVRPPARSGGGGGGPGDPGRSPGRRGWPPRRASRPPPGHRVRPRHGAGRRTTARRSPRRCDRSRAVPWPTRWPLGSHAAGAERWRHPHRIGRRRRGRRPGSRRGRASPPGDRGRDRGSAVRQPGRVARASSRGERPGGRECRACAEAVLSHGLGARPVRKPAACDVLACPCTAVYDHAPWWLAS